jgi:preprotein translocase, SecY subunit
MTKLKAVMKPLLITFLLVMVFRLGSYTPLFGFDGRLIARLNQNESWSLLGFASSNSMFTYFALGVVPFVNASILVQFLQLIPPFNTWKDQDRVGRKKQLQLTRVLALAFGSFQIYRMFEQIKNVRISDVNGTTLIGDLTMTRMFVFGIVLLAGTFFVSYLSDAITRHGIANGQSVIIVAGILSGISQTINAWKELSSVHQLILMAVFLVSALLIIVLSSIVVKIPLLSQRLTDTRGHILPLRLNAAGMLPILFASVLMNAPQFLSTWLPSLKNKQVLIWTNLASYRSIGLYAIVILVCAIAYNTVQVRPTDLAQHLARSGQYVEGVALNDTEIFITKLLRKMGLVSGLFVAILAVVPLIVLRLLQVDNHVLALLGSSLIIVITTVVDGVDRTYQLSYEAE